MVLRRYDKCIFKLIGVAFKDTLNNAHAVDRAFIIEPEQQNTAMW